MKAYRDRAAIQIGTGNFYRELQRLVSEGLVETAPRTEGVDPRRAPYAITARGSATFDRWFGDPDGAVAEVSYEDQLSARILFLGDVDDTAASTLLQRWQDDLWVRAKILERMRESEMASAPGSPGAFPALRVLLARRLRHVSADLALLEELRSLHQSLIETRRRAGAVQPASSTHRIGPSLPSISTPGRRKPQRK